jgi:hypothetical protein
MICFFLFINYKTIITNYKYKWQNQNANADRESVFQAVLLSNPTRK